MNHPLWDQLNRRIEAQHQYLCERLTDLALEVRAHNDALLARWEQHEAYHRREEPHWGFFRLAQRHPFRLAAAAAALAGLACTGNPGALNWLSTGLKTLTRIFTP